MPRPGVVCSCNPAGKYVCKIPPFCFQVTAATPSPVQFGIINRVHLSISNNHLIQQPFNRRVTFGPCLNAHFPGLTECVVGGSGQELIKDVEVPLSTRLLHHAGLLQQICESAGKTKRKKMTRDDKMLFPKQ